MQFRKDKYGSSGIRSFLRDVLAMANAPVDGPRYIRYALHGQNLRSPAKGNLRLLFR